MSQSLVLKTLLAPRRSHHKKKKKIYTPFYFENINYIKKKKKNLEKILTSPKLFSVCKIVTGFIYGIYSLPIFLLPRRLYSRHVKQNELETRNPFVLKIQISICFSLSLSFLTVELKKRKAKRKVKKAHDNSRRF